MSQKTDQPSFSFNLEEEDLEQVSGGQVSDKDGAVIGGLVGAKVLGLHNSIVGYKQGWKAAIPLLEKGGRGGFAGAAAGGSIGAIEGAVGGGLAGGIGVHEVNAITHQK